MDLTFSQTSPNKLKKFDKCMSEIFLGEMTKEKMTWHIWMMQDKLDPCCDWEKYEQPLHRMWHQGKN